MGIVTSGSGGIGSVLSWRAHTGHTHITITIAKAGKCTKDIGTAKTTPTATGEIMIVGKGMVIAKTAGTTATTDRNHECFAQSREPRSLGVNSWTALAGPTLIEPVPYHASLPGSGIPLW
jgi:hypothetical protein